MRTSKLKLAVLYTPLTTAGGGERQALEEVRWLRRLGHEVAAFTFELGQDALFIQGIDREEVTVLRGLTQLGRSEILKRALSDGFDLLLGHTSWELVWLATIGSGLPYIIYHNDPPFSSESNARAGSRRYRRVFRSVRGSVAGYVDIDLPPVASRESVKAEVRTMLTHRALRDARKVIVLSERTRRELRLLHGIDATIVRGCLDHRLLATQLPAERPELCPEGARILLIVSRLERVKRVDLVIRALESVRAEAPDSVLVVVGTGPEHENLVALTHSLGLADAVRFAGYVDDSELWRYYACASAFVCPALADFCITPYEALALGCRAVVTNELELEPEIVSSGWVFSAPPDARSFAASIGEALAAPDAPPLDLRFMTWESRAEKIAALCACALDRPAETAAERDTHPARYGAA